MEKGTKSNFVRSYGKHIVILFLFIVVGNVLLYLTYENVKREMIEGLNARQLIHAKQAARGIETFIGDNINILQNYSKNEHITAIDESGKRLMREFLSSQAGGVSIISREDSHGRILYAEPYDRKVIGQPVTRMEDFLKAKRTRQITVSDVFTNRRGFQSIIVHAPIFRRGSFDGTLAMLFSFDFIAKRYIDDIRIGKDGYAWMISRDGIELFCPVPGHVGNSVFDNCREFPDILAMAQRMIRGEQGVTTYLFDRIRGGAVSKTTKHAVFMPIRVGDNFWSIVVATPEDEVTSTLSGFQDRILLVAIFFVIGIGFFLYMLIKTGIVIKEVERRRKAEEELRKSEKRFRELAELLPEAVFETDIQGTLTFANKNAFDRFGYTPEDFAGGLNLLDTVTPHDRGRASESTQRIMNRENIGSNEYTMQRKDGTIFPAMIHSTAIIQDGKPVGLRGFAIDITESKQAEEKLRESEKKLSNIVQGFSIPAFVIGNDHKVLYWNQALEKLSKIPAAEVVSTNQHWRAFYAQERPCMADLLVDGVIDKVPQWYEGKYIKSRLIDGAYEATDFFPALGEKGRSLRFTAAAIRDSYGYLAGAVETLEDVTESKQAEEALRENEEKYRSIFDNAIEGIFQTTPEGRFLAVNPAMARIHGFASPEEMIADITDIGKQLYVNPEDREKYLGYLNENGEVNSFEAQIYRTDGSIIWTSASTRAIDDAAGNISRFEGTAVDITNRKRAGEEKQSLQERLQRAEKMESLGLLAGGVAHDLNNVLGIVVGYAELILEGADTASSIKPHLVNIMNGGQRAAAIVDDLLTLARRGVSGKEVLNLNEIIADCQQSPEFEKLYSYHPAVKINSDLEPDQPNITCSSVHLGKSFYNLVSNACEAMPKGGMVTIKTTSQYLEQPLQGYDEIRSGDYVVLSVSDTGQGISANDLKRIFEPFYTKKVMGRSGTGLGLAVVWGTVKDHHGYINVESEEGKGSTFTLYFPVTREDITAEGGPASISEYMGEGESILVVDDVKEQRDLAASILKALNYNVASVSSGEKAVAYLKENQADLMVLDMIMDPGMDGLDTYRSIIEIHPQQKAIIVSGFSESDRVHEAQGLGAGAYVKKPYIKEKLGLAVRKELDRSA